MNSSPRVPETPKTEADVTRVGLVSLSQAAAYLGLRDPRTVRKLVRENKLKARKIGSRILVTSKSLREFAEA
ncbi:helix-turn-helix domain-containing protein [Bifidobacterium sp. UTBIF-78]|uniref:helix-turn-helix domain-containing protein n=1 Tax=Bifidobacterium sp. UTBIF-78 TaxID=1465263 RepID=UPI0015E2A5A1|nr:helix-turn-helix domain-containing protein [Bifidobacterium sp. UTBIF-78]